MAHNERDVYTSIMPCGHLRTVVAPDGTPFTIIAELLAEGRRGDVPCDLCDRAANARVIKQADTTQEGNDDGTD